MANLFLCGGKPENGAKHELVALFTTAVLRKESKRILYIPLAMPEMVYKGVDYTYDMMFEAMRKGLSSYGVDRLEMWKDVSGKKYSDLQGYDGILIGGGNTFGLWDDFKKAGFDELLRKYISEDGIVYGCSAGAIILGKDIGTAHFGGDPDVNRAGLKDLSALNAVEDYAISCHYRESDDANLTEYSSKNRIGVIALPEEAGLLVTDEEMRIVGDSDAYMFVSSKKVRIGRGEIITRKDV